MVIVVGLGLGTSGTAFAIPCHGNKYQQISTILYLEMSSLTRLKANIFKKLNIFVVKIHEKKCDMGSAVLPLSNQQP